MLVQINGNTVNVRLTSFELMQFRKNGFIQTNVPLDSEESSFIKYSLEQVDEGNLEVTFGMNHFRIFVPIGLAEEWLESKIMHLEYLVKVDKFNFIRILICKDQLTGNVHLERKELLSHLNYVN